ncbi:MAG: hypothetical protein IPM18_00010 [Phycisphaerales bacterium]|nr:hypothetical protein [Phycisphaerales bacterium]
MRRTQGQNTYYTVFCLRDGTVTSAPDAKPAKRIMKRDHLRADHDNVIKEYVSSGKELLTIDVEQRVRFLDIIATSLNGRRALRQIVLPRGLSRSIRSSLKFEPQSRPCEPYRQLQPPRQRVSASTRLLQFLHERAKQRAASSSAPLQRTSETCRDSSPPLIRQFIPHFRLALSDFYTLGIALELGNIGRG